MGSQLAIVTFCRKDSPGGPARLQQRQATAGVADPAVPSPAAPPVLHCMQPKGSPTAGPHHSGGGGLQDAFQAAEEGSLQ